MRKLISTLFRNKIKIILNYFSCFYISVREEIVYLYHKLKELYIQDAIMQIVVALLSGILLKYLFGIG